MSDKNYHLFHIVDPSPWPIVSAMGAFCITSGGVCYFQSYSGGLFFLLFGLSLILFSMYVWWRDVIREGTYEGYHTIEVETGLRIGMVLFIISEIMFFFSFFWGFFHSSLAPAIELGSVWPPVGINVFNPWTVPFLNTLILLLSGVTCTWAHHNIVEGEHLKAKNDLIITILLAISFTALQVVEYKEATFNISDSVYGSSFFMATGFHGFHVIIGTCFITVCLIRLVRYQFSSIHHFGFEAAAWYWHFVDVVWLFLFVSIYWWGSL